MRNISITLGKDSHTIVLGRGALEKAVNDAKRAPLGRKYCVICDDHLDRVHGKSLRASLKKNSIDAVLVSVPSGEQHKTLRSVESICSQMASLGLGRDSAVIALGGGVVGDLAGFASGIYHRGIPYVHIPTTLLAMVDSSIGGKTGVDIPEGKNLVGLINQPRKVYMDPLFLGSLPDIELRCGLAEVIKAGAISDKTLLTFLDSNMKKILAKNMDLLEAVISRSVMIKKKVVETDERETGLRMILNFGHTIGHAIEHVENYKLRHGEAVAMGMAVESLISVKLGSLSVKERAALLETMRRSGLPTGLTRKYNNSAILDATRKDKKARNGIVLYVQLDGLGSTVAIDDHFAHAVSEKKILEAMSECRN